VENDFIYIGQTSYIANKKICSFLYRHFSLLIFLVKGTS